MILEIYFLILVGRLNKKEILAALSLLPSLLFSSVCSMLWVELTESPPTSLASFSSSHIPSVKIRFLNSCVCASSLLFAETLAAPGLEEEEEEDSDEDEGLEMMRVESSLQLLYIRRKNKYSTKEAEKLVISNKIATTGWER